MLVGSEREREGAPSLLKTGMPAMSDERIPWRTVGSVKLSSQEAFFRLSTANPQILEVCVSFLKCKVDFCRLVCVAAAIHSLEEHQYNNT